MGQGHELQTPTANAINLLGTEVRKVFNEQAMSKIPKDQEIEDRIAEEIVVDAYDEYERASGWYCYLGDHLKFPFTAKVISHQRTSPLKKGTTIEVTGIAPQEEFDARMRVTVCYDGSDLDVPLEQLAPADDENEDRSIAIEAWHYWVARGYQF